MNNMTIDDSVTKDPYKAPQHIQPTAVGTWVAIQSWLKRRLSRVYFLFYALCMVLAWLLVFIGCGYIARMVTVFWSFLPVAVLLVCTVLAVLLFIGLLIKRLHDANMGAWLSIFCLIPPLLLLAFAWPGTKGGNAFGDQPKAPSATLSFVVLVTTLSLLLIALSQVVYLVYGVSIQTHARL